MNNKIALLLPTRNRPSNIINFTTSVYDTAADKDNVSITFYVDFDDPISSATISFLKSQYPNISCHFGPRIVMSEMTNSLYPYTDADIIMFVGDDFLFRTPGWDTLVIEEFNKSDDKLILVYGDDKYNYTGVATHGFISRNWIDILGYIMPKDFEGDYGDTWVTDIADKLGRKILLDVTFEHMHYCAGKSLKDRTYIEKEEKTYYCAHPSHIKYQDRTNERNQDMLKILSRINNVN